MIVVVFVPGTCGSVLNSVDQEGKKQRVWLQGNLGYLDYAQQLIGYVDERTRELKQYMNGIRIEVEQGQEGVGYIIQGKILGKDVKMMNYFGKMMQWFEDKGIKCLAFGYDWRENLGKIGQQLKEFLENIDSERVVLVAHSLGNIVVDSVMKRWKLEKVKQWFAVCPPFNGLSGLTAEMLLQGYDSGSPLPKSLCRQIQLGSWLLYNLYPRNDGQDSFVQFWIMEGEGEREQEKLVKVQEEMVDECKFWLVKSVLKRMMEEGYELREKDYLKVKDIKNDWQFKKFCEQVVNHKECKQREGKIVKKVYTNKNYGELVDKVYKKGSWLRWFCLGGNDFDGMVQESRKWREGKVKEMNQQLKVISYVGIGVKTLWGLVYKEVVEDEEELLWMEPEKIWTNGDGTVGMKQAVGDGYDDGMIERWLVKVNDHSSMLQDEEWYKWIMRRLV